jgi:hypothetical protein
MATVMFCSHDVSRQTVLDGVAFVLWTRHPIQLLLMSDSSTQYHSMCPLWRNHQDTQAAYHVYGVDSKCVVHISGTPVLQYFSIAHEVSAVP